jgi:ATP-binding cassette, subfamily B, bacterial MsbA
MPELRAIKNLIPLLRFYPWSIPLIVMLGVTSSLAEGIGISLFIPFLESLQPDRDFTSINISSNLFVKLIEQASLYFLGGNKTAAIAILLLGAVGFKVFVSYIYTFLCYWLKSHVLHRLRSDVFHHLMGLEQSFWDTHKVGEIINTLTMEAELSSQALSHLVWLTIDSCTILVFGSLLLLISWKLTLLVLLSLIAISSITRYLTSQAENLGQQNLNATKQLQNQIVEALTGIKTVQAFSREPYERDQFDRASRSYRNFSISLYKLSAIIEPVSEGLSMIVLLAIVIVATSFHITFSIILTFVFMLYRLQPQVKKLDFNRFQVISLSRSVRDVMKLLKYSNHSQSNSNKMICSGLSQGILFESASFAYLDRDNPALKDVTFYIPKGQTTAFVGHSGAGKSTIINLIFRFYDLTAGHIYIDNKPLSELDISSWRSQIAMVSQDVHLFNSTIQSNIAYGKPTATTAEIIEAAKQAHADEFICNLPQGYETIVGDRGIRLSGGQKQRLSIARAILCDPEVLILDEATNALDSISEHLIQESLAKLSKNRTVIAIAHRLSTIEKAEQIIVLDRGQVAEQGNFQDLIKLDGLFAKLYYLQHENTEQIV